MDHEVSALAFFVRTGTSLKILTLGKHTADGKMVPKELAKLVHAPKSAAWSKDSNSLCVGDTTKGVVLITLRKGKSQVKVFPNSNTNTQQLWWSPSSKYLTTHHPPEKALPDKPNLLVWRTVADICTVEASFCVPKLPSNQCPLQFSADESLCVRILPPEKGQKRSVIHFLDANDLSAPPLHEIIEYRATVSAQWCNHRAPCGALRLAIFVGDGRNDMQRVSAPAEIRIYHLSHKKIELVKKCETPSGESADLQWSASGEGLLALVETEVDETGVSYYGSTRLILMSATPCPLSCKENESATSTTSTSTTTNNGDKNHKNSDKKSFLEDLITPDDVQELNKGEDGSYLPIQSVAWSPTDDVFVLIRGFQPAQVSIWKYDRISKTAKMMKVLAEKSHRNTVKFNIFGNVILVGGFGNLAGEMDFYGMTSSPDESDDCVQKISSAQANCTVSVEWSADGLHVITAVLAPRMRVENGFHVWNCLDGSLKHTEKYDELFEVGLRPHDGSHFQGPQRLELQEAAREMAAKNVGKPKRMAYRPPHARQETQTNNIKAMMLGEMSLSPRDSPEKYKGNKNDRNGGNGDGRNSGGDKNADKNNNGGNSGDADNKSSGTKNSDKNDSSKNGKNTTTSGANGRINTKDDRNGHVKESNTDRESTPNLIMNGTSAASSSATAGSSVNDSSRGNERGSNNDPSGNETKGNSVASQQQNNTKAGGRSGNAGGSSLNGTPNVLKDVSPVSQIPPPPDEDATFTKYLVDKGYHPSAADKGYLPRAQPEGAQSDKGDRGYPTEGGKGGYLGGEKGYLPAAAIGGEKGYLPAAGERGYMAEKGFVPDGKGGYIPESSAGKGYPGEKAYPGAAEKGYPLEGRGYSPLEKGHPPEGKGYLPPGEAGKGGYLPAENKGYPSIPPGERGYHHHFSSAPDVKGGYLTDGKGGYLPPGEKGYLPPGVAESKGIDKKGAMYYKGGEDNIAAKGAALYGKSTVAAADLLYGKAGAHGKPGYYPGAHPGVVSAAAAKGAYAGYPPGPAYGSAGAYGHPGYDEVAIKGKRVCPQAGWQYVDPKGQVQGPFNLEEMTRWNSAGYFRPELLMRFSDHMDFVRFDLLFPHPYIPFISYPNVPEVAFTKGKK